MVDHALERVVEPLVRLPRVLGQVQRLRERHRGVDAVRDGVPPPDVVKALELHDEHLGQAPQVDLLRRLLVLLAGGAVPRLELRQLLGLVELLQAVREADAAAGGVRLLLRGGVDGVAVGLLPVHVLIVAGEVPSGDDHAVPLQLGEGAVAGDRTAGAPVALAGWARLVVRHVKFEEKW